MKKEKLHITFCMALAMMAAQPLHGFAMDASKAEAISGGANEVANGIATRSASTRSAQNVGDTFTCQIEGHLFNFKVSSDNNVTITGLKNQADKSSIESINIPKTIEYNGTSYTITAIGDEAFEECSLTSITIPNTVEVIGESAFYASSLQSIHIPATVKSIGQYAFLYCKSLASVTFDENCQVTEITTQTFGNTSLTTITLPKSVTSIEFTAFEDNSKLQSITLLGDNVKLDYENDLGSAMNDNLAEDTKIYVPADALETYKSNYKDLSNRFKVYSVAAVGTLFTAKAGEGSYQHNYNFKVTSGNTVTIEGLADGEDIHSIERVVIPSTVEYGDQTFNVTAIAERAFSTYQAIETVSIPAGVETIGANAFNNCTNLSSVTFAAGSKLKTIGSGAFVATCFKEITLPTSLTTIEYNAFHSNKSLKSIVIPANVTYIGQDAFCTTTNLEYIILEGANTETVNHGQIAPDNRNVIIGVPAANLEAYKKANALLEGRIFATAEEDTKLTDESDNITATLADKLWQPGTLSYTRDLSNKTAGNYVTVCLPFDIDLCSLAKSGNLDAADEIYLLATESGSSDEGNRNLQPVTYKEGGIYKLVLGKAEYTGNATSCKVAANSPMLIKLGEKVAQNKSLTFSNSSVLAKSENDLEKLLQPASLDIKAADASVTAPDVDITCGGTFSHYDYDECKDFYTFNTKGTFGPQKKDLGANPFRVYLTIKDKAGEPLKNVNLSAVFGGGSGTTGINGVVSASGAAKSSAIYTLDGRKVATGSYGEVKLPKGIYIVGGKKVVVK